MLTAQSQAVYSGVHVYEMEVQNIACMRRRSDGWLNATQILKVAGVDKGKRTKVLEKEILVGEHEKVQGGYGKYQGTWISYKRGRQFCRQYGVEEILRPLLDYDVAADGSGGQGQDTPTKEQAMAANRKRFYNLDPGPNRGPSTNGTFFSNISCVGGNEQSCTVELPCSEAWNSAETAIQTHVAPREFPRR
jgi:regulatory protein SWI6